MDKGLTLLRSQLPIGSLRALVPGSNHASLLIGLSSNDRDAKEQEAAGAAGARMQHHAPVPTAVQDAAVFQRSPHFNLMSTPSRTAPRSSPHPLGLLTSLSSASSLKSSSTTLLSPSQHQRSFFSMPSFDDMRREFMSEDRAATSATIIANLCTYAATSVNRKLLMAMVQNNSMVHGGEWWRLLTASFCHTSLMHLLLNMLAIHWLGPPVEYSAGRTMFCAVYLGGALGGGLGHFWFGSPFGFAMGSSGAIAGLFAGFVVYKLRNRHHVGWTPMDTQWVMQMVALNVVLSLLSRGEIAHMAHMGGLVGGAAVMFLLGPRFVWVGGRVEDRPLLPLFRGWP